MKIKYLWVSEYKNLKNIDLHFNSDLVTLLVGKNGLGKSNLIEILALIFKDLDLIKTYSKYSSWAYEDGNFEFTIHYECHNNDIKIDLRKGSFEVFSRKTDGDVEYSKLSFSRFIKTRNEELLPKYIIGYYSGENKRISKITEKHEIEEKEFLKSFHEKDKGENKLLRRIFFTQNSHSQLLLLTLSLFKNSDLLGDRINTLFSDFLNITNVIDFKITFNNPKWNYTLIDRRNKGVDYLLSNISEDVQYPFWNVKGQVDKFLTRLYNHQIEHSSEPFYYENDGKEDKRKFVEEFLIFDKIDLSKFEEDLNEYFAHPIELFDALEASYILDIINSIEIKIEKEFSKDKAIFFEHLSEGEQQLITVLGLIMIMGTDDCLFLLDEPDTHLNPEWQRDYISMIEYFNVNELNSHFIIATHSPLIVQSAEKSDVFLFVERNGKINIDTQNYHIHNWRIDQVLVSEYFNLPSARPAKLDKYIQIREELLSKKSLNSIQSAKYPL